MYAYVLESEGFCKIGITCNINKRVKQYGFGITKRHIVEMKESINKYVAGFVELYVMCKFKSKSEYLNGASFDDVALCIEEAINSIPKKPFMFSLFDVTIPLYHNNEGYINTVNVTNTINEYRAKKGLTSVCFTSYINTKSAKVLCKQIEEVYATIPQISKNGVYGGYYVLPHILLDYIIWSSVELKILAYEYMYKNIEYCDLMELMPFYKKALQ